MLRCVIKISSRKQNVTQLFVTFSEEFLPIEVGRIFLGRFGPEGEGFL